VIQFIAETWGTAAPHAIIRALAGYPQMEAGYVYQRHDALFRGYLGEAIRSELGVGMDQFEMAWTSWIRKRK
jgi:hypothetical protein